MSRRADLRVTRRALKAYYPDGSYGRRLQPLPDYGAIYVRNAKAGTGTTMLWLHRMHSGDHGFPPKAGIHAKHGLPRPADVGWDKVVGMLAGEAFRFTFVRHPIKRVESAYRNKVDGWRKYPGRAGLQRALGLPEGAEHELTLDQFVAALEAQEPLHMDAHWRPQHLNLMHPLVEYDLIGRIETYAADLAKIRQATGMPDAPVAVQEALTRPTGSLFEGRPDLLRRVQDIYATDLELYGY
jgi:hypothetical protein